MSKTGGDEGRILREYLRGRAIKLEDKVIIKEMIATGLMKGGFSLESGEETAQTTTLGCRAI